MTDTVDDSEVNASVKLWYIRNWCAVLMLESMVTYSGVGLLYSLVAIDSRALPGIPVVPQTEAELLLM